MLLKLYKAFLRHLLSPKKRSTAMLYKQVIIYSQTSETTQIKRMIVGREKIKMTMLTCMTRQKSKKMRKQPAKTTLFGDLRLIMKTKQLRILMQRAKGNRLAELLILCD